jgi:hypothetical protein
MLIKAKGSHVAAMLAVQYALDNGADVMHMDLCYPRLGDVRGVWRRMCEHATCAGLLIVCPTADNSFGYNQPQQIHTPADVPCVIAVSGISPDRQVPSVVGRGPVIWNQVRFYGDRSPPEGQTKPDMVSFRGPGVRLLRGSQSADYLPADTPLASNVFASARVAGIAALVLSARRDLPPWRIKQIIEASATDIDPVGKDNRTGAGLVNAYAAVRRALAEPILPAEQ